MEILITACVVCLSNIICLLVGIKAGHTATKSEGVKISNPIEKAKARREQKELTQEQKQQQEAFKTMMHNIDVYDGTEAGQRDIKY